MNSVTAVFIFLLAFIPVGKSTAHPGSGIVADRSGNIYFTDTGKGVWKLDPEGKLSYIPSSRFHWLTIDPSGTFARNPTTFGQYFEIVAYQNSPGLVQCSDFPLVINKDGNLYYADTRSGSAKIIKRTPDGDECVFASNRMFAFVHGIAAGPDGSLYLTEGSNPAANSVQKITPGGKMVILATYAAKTARDLPLETTPSYCRGLAVDSAGNIYVAATGSRSVLKISPRGQVLTMVQEQVPWTPTGVTVYKGEVYILEWHDVKESQLEVRTAYIPRIRKVGHDGKRTTLATVTR